MAKKKPKRILVTGASGYYGTSLLRCFSETKPPEKVVAVDIRPPRARFPFVDFRRMDIRDPKLAEVMESEKIETVAHLAFALNVFRPDREIRDVNIGGIGNMLDCCAAAGVKRFVLASSSTAVGAFPDNEGPFAETAPPRATPGLFYTRDKAEIENAVTERCPAAGIKYAIIRPSIITGRSMDNLLSTLLKTFYFIPVPAERDTPLQFVHEDDLARATRLIIESTRTGVYHVTGDGGVPFSDIIRLAGKRPVRVPVGLMRYAARRVDRLGVVAPFSGALDLINYPWLIGNDRIKKDFGFEFRCDSRAALEEFTASTKS